MRRHPSILSKDSTGLLIIDIQERINAVMRYGEVVVENTVKLIQGFKALKLPIVITEQYREGLGATESQILEELGDAPIVEKLTFSCCGSAELMIQLQDKNVQQIVICGIETHVCVQQTALDLIANDFLVYLVRDAVSSRTKIDHKTAIERMRDEGVTITTAESVLFELLVKAKTDEFKEISRIVK
ncbi:hydrolase [candidate division KSB1 bacterium]|nr:hydrolase [candidate division KSB1 bacterium]MBL7093246.1 hydrolase [candidate division KSB1 bacterium]